MNIAIDQKGKKPLPPKATEDDLEDEHFTRGNGKCRDSNGQFDTNHSYFPTGPNDRRPKNVQKRVRDINACKNVCINDPRCTAFHFYMLDPGHYNNCWIWTEPGYTANGSSKAYCFVKNKDAAPVPISEDPFDKVLDAHDHDMGDDHHHNDNHAHTHTHGDVTHTHEETREHSHTDTGGFVEDHIHETLQALNNRCTRYINVKGCVSLNNI